MYLGRLDGWQYWAFARVNSDGQIRLYLYRKGPLSRWKTQYLGAFEPQRLALNLKRLGLWAGVRALAVVFSKIMRITKRKAVYLDREALEEVRKDMEKAREELEERIRRYVRRNELALQDVAMAAQMRGEDPYDAVFRRVLEYALEQAEELGLGEEGAERVVDRVLRWAW